MAKIIKIFVTFLLIATPVLAGKKEMIQATLSIPGIVYAEFPQDSSFWVAMDQPQGHNYEQYGYLLCEGGAQKYGMPKGYTITFWNRYTKKPLYKFRCY